MFCLSRQNRQFFFIKATIALNVGGERMEGEGRGRERERKREKERKRGRALFDLL